MARDRDYEDDDRDRLPDRDRGDDYDDRPVRREKPGGLDGFFGNTAVVVILSIIGIFCCNIAWAIFGLVGMVTCKDPIAKRNATIMLVIDGLAFVLALVLNFTGALGNLQQR